MCCNRRKCMGNRRSFDDGQLRLLYQFLLRAQRGQFLALGGARSWSINRQAHLLSMSTIATIVRLVMALQDPEVATRVAAHAWAPGLVDELVGICRRESRCRRKVSEHARDSHHGRKVYARAVERGWLRPFCQAPGEGWSTRGSHGLMAGYHVRLLGVPCLPASAMDVPLLSAIAAARKAQRLCRTRQACDADSLRGYWNGRAFSNRAVASMGTGPSG